MDLQQERPHRKATDGTIILCSTCDRCRARRIKCDGRHPCGYCVSKYKSTNKLESVEGIDAVEFKCVYSPAKRRGPITGTVAARKIAVELQRVSTSSSAGGDGKELDAVDDENLETSLKVSIDSHHSEGRTDEDDLIAARSEPFEKEFDAADNENLETSLKVSIDSHHSEGRTDEDDHIAAGSEPFDNPVISLRPWMDKALRLIGNTDENGKRTAITSESYLRSALKIASCLTQQIIQAQNLKDDAAMLDDNFLTNSDGRDWAAYVKVQLGDFEDDELVSLPENKALESFLKSSEEDSEYHATSYRNFDDVSVDDDDLKLSIRQSGWERDVAKGNNDRGVAKDLTTELLQHDSFDAGDIVGHVTATHVTATEAKKSCHMDPLDDSNYLSIKTATIQCPRGKLIKGNDDKGKDSKRRIYHLGLVFYELFSGGELPPESLQDLSSCENAFDSLSILSLVNDDNKDQTSSVTNKRHQGLSLSAKDIGLCELSCEYLRLAGVTNPICDMIFNMLDSVYGDLSGKESYTNMIDVAFDLQLMIDKPSKFLRGLDTDRLSVSGLPINDIEIPREEEFQAIKSCYNRSISGSGEIAVIKGDSGTGKTWLAYRLGSYVINGGGLFLTGKFDQMHHNQAKPFSALAAAFDQYCELLITLKESDSVAFDLTVGSLTSALGQDEDLRPLLKLIPRLRIILGEKMGLEDNIEYDDSAVVDNWANKFSRLQYLISQFINAITMSSIVSVVLLIDDLQWIDEASLAVLGTILRQKHEKFFFVGCCRDDKMSGGHSFWEMMDGINAVGVNATQIKLNCMNGETLKAVVSDLLCISPRLVESLSSILFTRTRGNVLFFLQFLMLLYHNRFLYINLSRQRWAWDEDKIVSVKLPDNIAICFTTNIVKLPSEVQSALNTLAMFGTSTKVSYLELLEYHFDMKILEPLIEAEGLVSITNGSCGFCHDCIQEVSLNLVQDQDRRSKHLDYGKCLANKALDEKDAGMLFTAVDQINLGGPSAVTDYQDYFSMASFNLVAGKLSMSMSEFGSALSFFKHGISFLRDGHWRDHYSFSLEIYEWACRSADAATKISCLNVLSERVLNEARSFEDTLEIQLIRMNMFANSTPKEALELGLSIVSKLGEEIPSITEEALDLKQVKAMMGDISEDLFLNYGLMTDTKKLFAMRFLSRIQIVAYYIMPVLNPLITLKMLQITVLHGLSPQAPLTFEYFGGYLASLGDLRTGYRFIMFGKSLLNKLGVYEQTGEAFAAASEIQMFVEPSLSVLEVLLQGEHAALRVGDMYWACMNRCAYCDYAAGLQNDLSFVSEFFYKARDFFEQQEHQVALSFNVSTHCAVLRLLGNVDKAMALENRFASIINLPVPHLAKSHTFHKLYLSYLMNTGNLIECFDTFWAIEVEEYFLTFGRSIMAFFSGLAAFQIYRETGDLLWKNRGTQCMKEIELWAEQGSSWTFEHKLQLMKAECYYCSGNFEHATESYKKATKSAKAYKSYYAEALACELAGKFFLETGNINVSLQYLRLAHEKYRQWQADGKANQLIGFIRANFTADFNTQPSE